MVESGSNNQCLVTTGLIQPHESRLSAINKRSPRNGCEPKAPLSYGQGFNESVVIAFNITIGGHTIF